MFKPNYSRWEKDNQGEAGQVFAGSIFRAWRHSRNRKVGRQKRGSQQGRTRQEEARAKHLHC